MRRSDPVLALPVVEPAIGRRAFGRERPDFFARRRVEREHRAVFADHIHHVVDDERAEGEAPGRARRRMEPLQLELVDVALVDLLQRGILRPLDAAARLAPGRIQPRARLAAHDRELRSGRDAIPRHRNTDPRVARSRDHSARHSANTVRDILTAVHFAVSTRRRGGTETHGITKTNRRSLIFDARRRDDRHAFLCGLRQWLCEQRRLCADGALKEMKRQIQDPLNSGVLNLSLRLLQRRPRSGRQSRRVVCVSALITSCLRVFACFVRARVSAPQSVRLSIRCRPESSAAGR